MHILMVNNIYPPIMAGGAELIVAWLSEGLVAKGHRVTVVSTCAKHMEPYPVEDVNGVRIIRFFPENIYWNFERQGQAPHRRMLWHLRDAWNLSAGRMFASIIAQSAPDVVHTHLIDGLSATTWHQAKLAGVPVVHTAHDYHLLCPRAFLLTRDWRICREPALGCQIYRRWHLSTTRHIDLFVSPSRFLLDQHRASGLPVQRTAVVRNGVHPPRRIGTARKASGCPRFLLLSRLTVEKGISIVLNAIKLLPEDLVFELIIAGRGPLDEDIRKAAATDSRILYVGYVTGDAKAALLSGADYLLIPSLWYENAPVAVIEAAAYGIGVIGSRIGGIPELVREGQTGFLFEPGNVEELAAYMKGLILGEIQLEGCPAQSAAVVEEHSVSHMVDTYVRQYEDLLCSHDRHLERA